VAGGVDGTDRPGVILSGGAAEMTSQNAESGVPRRKFQLLIPLESTKWISRF